MDNLYDFLKEKKFILTSVFLGIVSIVFGCLYFKKVDASEAFTCPTKVVETFTEDNSSEVKNNKIHVDIKGAVVNPGVYEVNEGLVVDDLINLAGGLTKNADTSNINLSKTLEDEMVIIIYTKEEVEEILKNDKNNLGDATINDDVVNNETIITNNTPLKEDEKTSGKISLNTASLEELMKIPGIGEAKAKAIIEYRKTCGSFEKIEDIKNIKGIGDAVFAKLKDYITV